MQLLSRLGRSRGCLVLPRARLLPTCVVAESCEDTRLKHTESLDCARNGVSANGFLGRAWSGRVRGSSIQAPVRRIKRGWTFRRARVRRMRQQSAPTKAFVTDARDCVAALPVLKGMHASEVRVEYYFVTLIAIWMLCVPKEHPLAPLVVLLASCSRVSERLQRPRPLREFGKHGSGAERVPRWSYNGVWRCRVDDDVGPEQAVWVCVRLGVGRRAGQRGAAGTYLFRRRLLQATLPKRGRSGDSGG